MTVCIAAICQQLDDKGTPVGTLVFGASDRKMTYGDIEFEPPTTKNLQLTSSIVLMSSANDHALQTEILRGVQVEVEGRVKEDPQNWWKVRDVADVYVKHRNLAMSKRAESQILAPLGLSLEKFIGRQKELSPELVSDLYGDLRDYVLPYLGALIVGVDPEGGAHIYVVESGEEHTPRVNVSCHDGLAFASIGSGAWHANSQFTLAKHTWHAPVADTLGLVYWAKKKAEIAPGVGAETDMFVIGPQVGTYNTIGDHVHKTLSAEYKRRIRAETNSQGRYNGKIREFVQEALARQAASQATAPANPSGNANNSNNE